jgi:predicted acylesterase/phospholipase RssA
MPSYQVKLAGREQLAKGTLVFRFEKPVGFTFKAGRAVVLELLDPPAGDGQKRRTFSLVSAPCCAIPATFPPVRVGERYLIDGAVATNAPISVAVELGVKRAVVLPTGYACALEGPPRDAIGCALHALTLLIAHQLVTETERCREQVEIITVPPLCPLSVSPYDFSHAGELIERAADQTSRWLNRGGLAKKRVPGALRGHTH